MNHLSAIANAPTLVQEIARQVSSIATLIGKVAHAAISYLVATLQAVPPLLPLMIVVVAGVTISAIIIRNVLYPEASSSSQPPPTNPSQNLNDDSSIQNKKPPKNRQIVSGPVISTARKRKKESNPFYKLPNRILHSIQQSSSGSDTKKTHEGENLESSSDDSSDDGSVTNVTSFALHSVYPKRKSEENLEIINELPVDVDVEQLKKEDTSNSDSEKKLTKTNSQTFAIDLEIKDEEDDANKVNETTLTRTSSKSSFHEPIEDEIVNGTTSLVSHFSEDEEDDKTKLPTRTSSISSLHETVDIELQPLQDVDKKTLIAHPSLVHSDNEYDKDSNEDLNEHIHVSANSSFSTNLSVAESKVDENKKASRFDKLRNIFEFGTGSKKGDQLKAPLRKSYSSSASTTRSENGDLQVPKFSFSRAASSFINSGSTKSTTVASTIPKPQNAATTDDLSTKTHLDLEAVKKRFQGIAAKLNDEKKSKSTSSSSTSQPKIEEPKNNESDLITEDWPFGKDDSKDLNVTTNDKLSAVSEVDETASVSSNDNARDVETT